MTREEILALEPGEKLDELLEQKVFGSARAPMPRRLSDTWWGLGVVVEAMREKGWLLRLSVWLDGYKAGFERRESCVWACADAVYVSAPHAVALAALLALEGEGGG